MAFQIFGRLADDLNVSMDVVKTSGDEEGFCFHRKKECSAMIAVAMQKKSGCQLVDLKIIIYLPTQVKATF